MPTVHVDLKDRSYDVLVERDLISRAGELIVETGLRGKAALVTDSNVAPLHGDALLASLRSAGLSPTLHVVAAGEASKSMDQVKALCSAMAEAGHDRRSLVIALGGGVVGDLAGFVASVFYRGIPLVQIPTTIVAQVDSSVGGKTGVNLPEGKNLLGAFHQPARVIVDPGVLATLPGREFREGFAEVIKHAAIRDGTMLTDIAALDPESREVPAELIARNIAIKARIVESDELEIHGARALLNFGHTIGHGIEAALPYGEILHGEAISLGLRAALFLSRRHAGLAAQDAAMILGLLDKFRLPLVLDPRITRGRILQKMGRDKKFEAGKIRFVLLRRAGDAYLGDEVTPADLEDAIDHLREPVTTRE